jgi:hypothetical protein
MMDNKILRNIELVQGDITTLKLRLSPLGSVYQSPSLQSSVPHNPSEMGVILKTQSKWT